MTSLSSLSPEYITQARPSCLLLFMQEMAWALSLALLRAGRSRAARIAMMAITTSSSMRVKAADFMCVNSPGAEDPGTLLR